VRLGKAQGQAEVPDVGVCQRMPLHEYTGEVGHEADGPPVYSFLSLVQDISPWLLLNSSFAQLDEHGSPGKTDAMNSNSAREVSRRFRASGLSLSKKIEALDSDRTFEIAAESVTSLCNDASLLLPRRLGGGGGCRSMAASLGEMETAVVAEESSRWRLGDLGKYLWMSTCGCRRQVMTTVDDHSYW
jgi:hypothetical protein